jgi:hypothetical protein
VASTGAGYPGRPRRLDGDTAAPPHHDHRRNCVDRLGRGRRVVPQPGPPPPPRLRRTRRRQRLGVPSRTGWPCPWRSSGGWPTKAVQHGTAHTQADALRKLRNKEPFFRTQGSVDTTT